MYWIKSVVRPHERVLVVDTVDGAEEWHDIKTVTKLVRKTGIQIFGLTVNKSGVSVNAMEDPRTFLLRELKVLARKERYGGFDSHLEPKCLEVRYFGHWEISEEDKAEMMREYGCVEEDWDWKSLTGKTCIAIKQLLSRIHENYGYRFSFEVGEKEWLYFYPAGERW